MSSSMIKIQSKKLKLSSESSEDFQEQFLVEEPSLLAGQVDAKSDGQIYLNPTLMNSSF